MDTLQLIDKVHSYYSDSFTQLMYLTVSILVIIGVIMPFVLQSLQARSFRSEKDSLESLIKGEIQNARIEMKSVIEKMFTKKKEDMQQLLDEKIKAMKQLMEEEVDTAKGGIFFLQGQKLIEKEDYSLAARDMAFAATLYFPGKEDSNGQRALDIFLNDCLPNVVSSDFEEIPDFDNIINDLLDKIEEKNKNHRFDDDRDSIKRGVAKAKKTRSAITEK